MPIEGGSTESHEVPAAGPHRRELLKRAAVVGGAAWVAPLVQSLTAPAFAATARSPMPARSCGRMTGGGVNPGLGGLTRYGFELHCAPGVGPNNLEIAFVRGGHEVNFHLDTLTSVTCSNTGGLEPDPPAADFDTLVGTGTGHLTGPGAVCRTADSAAITFRLVDAGEPGTSDYVEFHITCGSTHLLDVEGQPFGGNRQAHKSTGGRSCG